MPSSNKTSRLNLNHWQGADKPKREDFNADNTLVDAAYGALSASVADLDAAQQQFKSSASTSLAGLDARCDNIGSDLSAHKSDAAAHITAAERSSWNSLTGAGAGMETGVYTGTGTATLKIPMGFRPKCGFLFAAGSGIVETNATLTHTYVYVAWRP